MSSIIHSILENEDFQNTFIKNEEIISEAEQMVSDFNKVIKSFVIAHPNEFIAESIDQIVKNIKVFTEVATCQYMCEVSSMISPYFVSDQGEVTQETSNDPYF